MNGYRVSLVQFGLGVALLGAGFAGCRGAEPLTESNDQAARGPAAEAECLDFSGNVHCPLGAAQLQLSDDGSGLRVAGLREAQRDGVSIHLPEVTEFAADGKIEGSGTALHANAISEGVSTSTMTLQRTGEGLELSATFTGQGSASVYDVNLYQRGALVGQLRNVRPDVPVPVAFHNCHRGHPNYPNCWPVIPRFKQSSHRFRAAHGDFATPPPDMVPGACAWSVPMGDTGEVRAKLADGREVLADVIELVEVVPASGSYPYLTFNRIDYTTDGSSVLITNERVR